jgi:hypothetical protein
MGDVRRGRVWPGPGRRLRACASALVTAAIAASSPARAQSVAASDEAPVVRLGHVSVREKHGEPLAVFVDGVEAGPAPWEGDLEEGPHQIFGKSATRTTVLERIVVASGATASVELAALPRAVPAPPMRIVTPAAVGASGGAGSPGDARGAPSNVGPYGGVEAQLLLEPSGTHSDICSASGVTNCSTSAPIGGGFAAYAGYTVAPVGIDAMFGFQADTAGVKGKVAGTPQSLTIPRVGGVFAVRARLAWNSPSFGASLAAGVGVGIRDVVLIGVGATSKPYVSPAIVVDGALRARLAATTAFSCGLMLWGENAGNGTALKVSPLTTAVHFVASTQFFALPYVGIEFGP